MSQNACSVAMRTSVLPALSAESQMSDVSFSIVPYEACVQEVILFRNANRVLARDRGYFQWRYERRPCRQKPVIVWGVNSKGRKIAAASVIPHDFYLIDGVYPVGLLGDISVDQESRGTGVATRMLQFLQQEPACQTMCACVVLPNDDLVHSLERGNWCNATTIARFVKVVDIGPRLHKWLGTRGPLLGLPRGINFLARFACMEGWRPFRSPYHAIEVGDFDYEFDELWDELPKHGRVLALRNRNYLHWRFHEHPVERYRIIEIRHGRRLRGYVVFHVADSVVIIDDFLTVDTTAGSWLIRELLALVRHERLATDIQVRYNAGNFLAIPWPQFGFMRRRDSQRVMANASSADRCPLLSSDGFDWFITAGDKDV